MRKPFSIDRKIDISIDWYGTEYSFYRKQLNSYGEFTNSSLLVQNIKGIYHASKRAFVELVNSDAASVKSKVSTGILCSKNNDIFIRQNDFVTIKNCMYFVTAIEPVFYGNDVIGYEISVEELIEGNQNEN